MYPRLALALLFGFAAIGFGLAIPAIPSNDQCSDVNAEFRECGPACPPTCRRPHPPHCSLRCIRGCYCVDGYLKNDEGKCVPTSQCDAQDPLLIPAAFSPTCPEKEEFLGCGSACAPTCANPIPSPVCTKNCVVGCFCLEGHLRNEHGVCVPKQECKAAMIIPVQPRVCEDPNEEFRQCRGCDGTCDQPNPICPRICVAGCACKLGHLRDGDSGKCIPRETCDKAQKTTPASVDPHCSSDREMYVEECGTQMDCMATCHMPLPWIIHGHVQIPKVCQEKKCDASCVCKYPYVRNEKGDCVERAECDNHITPVSPTRGH